MRRIPMTDKPPRHRASRRPHSKSIARRQRILDAAARSLAEHGYAEAKLSDIAREAGTHAGALYYYFPSREELVKEVLLTSLRRMSEFSDSLEDERAQMSPLDRALAFVRMVIDRTLAPDDYYFRAYLRNGSQVPASVHKALESRRHQMRRTLARLLSEAQAIGQIPPQLNAGIVAHFVVGATNWVGMWYEPTGPYSAREITDTFVELVLGGLSGAQGTAARKRKAAQA